MIREYKPGDLVQIKSEKELFDYQDRFVEDLAGKMFIIEKKFTIDSKGPQYVLRGVPYWKPRKEAFKRKLDSELTRILYD